MKRSYHKDKGTRTIDRPIASVQGAILESDPVFNANLEALIKRFREGLITQAQVSHHRRWLVGSSLHRFQRKMAEKGRVAA